MGRPAYGGRATCEGCNTIDVRRWQREGRLRPGHSFSVCWTRNGEPSGNIRVRIGDDVATLTFQWRRPYDGQDWQNVNQSVCITWTRCNYGGRRPWFRCANCTRRVAVLYLSGSPLFACRRCYGLAYASQQETPRDRGILLAQKIRMRLGGSPSLADAFPDKPPRMRWSTYWRLRDRADAAETASTARLMQYVLGRFGQK